VLDAQGVGGVQCEIFPEETCWHVSNVQQGDVIIFHSCTVHKAEANTADKAVRLSVDTRFCNYGAPVFISNIDPHHGWRIEGLSWESIYANWQDTNQQYYWRDYPELFDEIRDQKEWHKNI
jgi:ectoine hydroxylase-related dioxygenase (phytanoyl-CoA dioxygenase family)